MAVSLSRGSPASLASKASTDPSLGTGKGLDSREAQQRHDRAHGHKFSGQTLSRAHAVHREIKNLYAASPELACTS